MTNYTVSPRPIWAGEILNQSICYPEEATVPSNCSNFLALAWPFLADASPEGENCSTPPFESINLGFDVGRSTYQHPHTDGVHFIWEYYLSAIVLFCSVSYFLLPPLKIPKAFVATPITPHPPPPRCHPNPHYMNSRPYNRRHIFSLSTIIKMGLFIRFFVWVCPTSSGSEWFKYHHLLMGFLHGHLIHFWYPFSNLLTPSSFSDLFLGCAKTAIQHLGLSGIIPLFSLFFSLVYYADQLKFNPRPNPLRICEREETYILLHVYRQKWHKTVEYILGHETTFTNIDKRLPLKLLIPHSEDQGFMLSFGGVENFTSGILSTLYGDHTKSSFWTNFRFDWLMSMKYPFPELENPKFCSHFARFISYLLCKRFQQTYRNWRLPEAYVRPTTTEMRRRISYRRTLPGVPSEDLTEVFYNAPMMGLRSGLAMERHYNKTPYVLLSGAKEFLLTLGILLLPTSASAHTGTEAATPFLAILLLCILSLPIVIKLSVYGPLKNYLIPLAFLCLVHRSTAVDPDAEPPNRRATFFDELALATLFAALSVLSQVLISWVLWGLALPGYILLFIPGLTIRFTTRSHEALTICWYLPRQAYRLFREATRGIPRPAILSTGGLAPLFQLFPMVKDLVEDCMDAWSVFGMMLLAPRFEKGKHSSLRQITYWFCALNTILSYFRYDTEEGTTVRDAIYKHIKDLFANSPISARVTPLDQISGNWFSRAMESNAALITEMEAQPEFEVPTWITFLTAALDGTKSIEDSRAARHASTFVSLVLSLPMLLTATQAEHVKTVLTFAGLKINNDFNLRNLVACFLFFAYFAAIARQVGFDAAWTYMNDDERKRFNVCKRLNSLVVANSPRISEGVNDKAIALYYNQSIKQFTEKATLAKTKSEAQTLRDYCYEVKTLERVHAASMNARKSHQTQLGVIITGESQTGKSRSINVIDDMVHSIYNLKEFQSMGFLTPKSKHDNNVFGYSTSIYLDDAGNTKAAFAQMVTSPAENAIRCINVAPMILEKADLESKSGSVANHIAYYCTSNVEFAGMCGQTNDPQSIINRFPICVETRLRKEYTKPGGGVDLEKGLRDFPFAGRTVAPWTEYSFYQMRLDKNKGSPGSKAAWKRYPKPEEAVWLNYEDFLRAVKKKILDFRRVQDQASAEGDLFPCCVHHLPYFICDDVNCHPCSKTDSVVTDSSDTGFSDDWPIGEVRTFGSTDPSDDSKPPLEIFESEDSVMESNFSFGGTAALMQHQLIPEFPSIRTDFWRHFAVVCLVRRLRQLHCLNPIIRLLEQRQFQAVIASAYTYVFTLFCYYRLWWYLLPWALLFPLLCFSKLLIDLWRVPLSDLVMEIVNYRAAQFRCISSRAIMLYGSVLATKALFNSIVKMAERIMESNQESGDTDFVRVDSVPVQSYQEKAAALKDEKNIWVPLKRHGLIKTPCGVGMTHDQFSKIVDTNSFTLKVLHPDGHIATTAAFAMDATTMLFPRHVFIRPHPKGESGHRAASELEANFLHFKDGIVDQKIVLRLKWEHIAVMLNKDLALANVKSTGTRAVWKLLPKTPVMEKQSAVIHWHHPHGIQESPETVIIEPGPVVYTHMASESHDAGCEPMKFDLEGITYRPFKSSRGSYCCSPIVSNLSGVCLAGFHIAGSDDGRCGGVYLTQTDGDAMKAELRSICPQYYKSPDYKGLKTELLGNKVIVRDEVHPKNFVNFLPLDTGAEIHAVHEKDFTPRNDLEPHPCAGIFHEITGAETHKVIPRFTNRVFRKLVTQGTGPQVELDTEAMEAAVRDYLGDTDLWVRNARAKFNLEGRPFTLNEITDGIEGNPYIASLDLSKSGGPFLPGKKEKVFVTVEGGNERTMLPAVLEEYKNLHLNTILGEHTGFFYQSFFKAGEPVSPDKIDEPRVIQNDAMFRLLLNKQYYGPIMCVILANPEMNETALGLDPYGEDWHKYLANLENDETDPPEGLTNSDEDYKGFDLARGKVRNYSGAIFRALAVALGYSDEALDLLDQLFSEVLNPLIKMAGTIISLDKLMPSGCFITALINTIDNCLLARYSFYKSTRMFDPVAKTQVSFRDYIAARRLGDDTRNKHKALYWTIKHLWPKEKFAEDMREIGLNLTASDKTQNFTYKRPEDAVFLQRKTVVSQVTGLRFGRLEEESLIKPFFWWSPSSDPVMYRESICRNYLIEFAHRSLEEFLSARDDIFLYCMRTKTPVGFLYDAFHPITLMNKMASEELKPGILEKLEGKCFTPEADKARLMGGGIIEQKYSIDEDEWLGFCDELEEDEE